MASNMAWGRLILILQFLLLSASTAAQNCRSVTLTASINTTAATINTTPPATQEALTDFLQQTTSPTLNFPTVLITGSTPLVKKYSISGKLCLPTGKSTGTLLFATHGLSFDHTYWEAGGPSSKFNFAASANAAGNAIFYYDRLGIGASSKPDGIKEVQSPVQVEVAHSLVTSIRAGALHQAFSKIIGVGHALGSVTTVGIAAKYPTDFDDIILTGFAGGDNVGILISLGAFGATIASQALKNANTPSNSYFAVGSFIDFQQGFLKYPFFDAATTTTIFNTRGTVTIGELTTLAIPASAPATDFTGRVLVVTGNNDHFFCAGNCAETVNGVTLPNVAAGLFPAASDFKSIVPLNTGHAINLHQSAPATFAAIQSWIAA
ncbi:hypothetical protein SISSUDRAFT_1037451 [Sistotremastrum suecicum HHB10207 ss-3]|uniref:Uncharacterized protein n=1 Tax=Sistotremastrum suecicum HHB10207 ss-3 TaxID=1314776 RepID=A0A165Y4F0_9AGAM|nr:hypothetical protein SISSUDRAFT_1037451 [Sistotremastrum suecicum HHB10207 ss-3]